ncbi:hypothetical protein [Arthrobacter oryzae]|uniref:hypothetical protein n=2 Tax=Arthrobacter TaxID=1663 RepID=UPI0011CE4DF1|nr:hypothetical protein [Arthrobacter oryzae]
MRDHDERGSAMPVRGHRSKPHEPHVHTGVLSTKDLQELAQRRREAEEKLQQHLLEAKQKQTGH